MRTGLVALIVAACSQPAKPSPTCGIGTPSLCPAEMPNPHGLPTIDAPGASDDEKLAAIQMAMNELDEAAQICWAAAATERFDIEGELTVMIDIAATSAKAQVMSDTARNPQLATCLVQLLGGYRWAPPLHGQAIQLPFKFRAPDGQSVIDRKLVAWHGQDKLSVAVLLDENNTGNAAASMIEIAIAAGGSTGVRIAERAELWYFLGPAKIGVNQTAGSEQAPPHGVKRNWAAGATLAAGAGDMMFVRKGAVRDVTAGDADVHAVIVVFPGGREGTARAGALPTPVYTATKKSPPGPAVFGAKNAKTYGPATIFIEPANVKEAPFSAAVLKLAANVKVPEHVHANETELLYVLEGTGTMTIAGTEVAVTPTSVIQIPPNTKHAFAATSDVRAVQLYTPAGPEQRFKAKP